MSNSLAAVHPELVAEWSNKNLPLTPDSITYGSNKKVWWNSMPGLCGQSSSCRITQKRRCRSPFLRRESLR